MCEIFTTPFFCPIFLQTQYSEPYFNSILLHLLQRVKTKSET